MISMMNIKKLRGLQVNTLVSFEKLILDNESGESFANPCFQPFLSCDNVTSTQGTFCV